MANNVWEQLSSEPKEPKGVMTDAFIMKFSRHLNWHLLSKHYEFSIDMLRVFQHRVVWSLVLKRQKLSESFLREMAMIFDNDSWSVLSRYQVLSETFIRDFADKVDWDNIILYQFVTGRFLQQYYKCYTPAERQLVVE